MKIVYFGLVRGGKGLDDVILFSQKLAIFRPDVEFHVVCGEPLKGNRDGFNDFKQRLSKSTVLHIGTPTADLPNILSQFDMAFLPFPGGVDENRSSFLALISLGVMPITYISNRTPKKISDHIFHCSTAFEAIDLIPAHRSSLSIYKEELAWLAKSYSWEHVVEKHIELYSDIINK